MDPNVAAILSTLGVPGQYIALAATVVGVASAIATTLPGPSAGSWKVYKVGYTLLNWVALNVGKAKNAESLPVVAQKT